MSVFVTAIGDPVYKETRAALTPLVAPIGEVLKICVPCPNGKKVVDGVITDCAFDLVVAKFEDTNASATVNATRWVDANKAGGLSHMVIYITC